MIAVKCIDLCILFFPRMLVVDAVHELFRRYELPKIIFSLVG